MPQGKDPMHHDVLGDIAPAPHTGGGVASVLYQGRSIEVSIYEDEISYEGAIEEASKAVQALGELDKKAKQYAASQLTETYNGGWNEYEQVQQDGSFKSVTNPKLTESQFQEKLSLASINVTGLMLEFFYENGGMFWGHSIIVTSFNGIKFNDLHAEIFG